jgi:phage tail-like protein
MAKNVEFRLHVKGPESAHDFVLPVGKAVLGRDPGCELVLAYPLVSRRHAQFTCTETECEVLDLGSANGTVVNGVKLDAQVPASLQDGSVITIGPFEIQVEVVAGEYTGADEYIGGAEPTGGMGAAEAAQPPAGEQEATTGQPSEAEKPETRVESKEAPSAPPKPVKKAARPAAEAAKKDMGQVGAPPPPAPPQADFKMGAPEGGPGSGLPMPTDLGIYSQRLLNYLPGIYQTDFMSRFLALFESILIPIEWNVDNFDIYLDPGTAPLDFLPWLANWYMILFDSTWSEPQRRTLLNEAHQIYARRGTRWALSRVLEIYLGQKPEISEFTNEKEPFTFSVNLPIIKEKVNQELVEAIIDSSKPAHTTYRLTYK